MENKKEFPADFLWGAASAAYQIEGATSSNGKGPSIWDVFSKIHGKTKNGTNGDVAVDHYHRYHEDVELMAKLGLKAYRFSIAWSRIIPDGDGEINLEGIKFYKDLITDLKKHRIEPIVTLYHWDLPQALQNKYGGWESRKVIPAFLKYCRTLFDCLGKQVTYWITFNEQNVFTNLGYRWASHPPNVKDIKKMYQANHIINLANARAIKLFHQLIPTGKIGPSFGYGEVYPATSNPIDVLAAINANQFNNDWWLDVYCHGKYPEKIMRTLKEFNVCPEVSTSDRKILENEQSHPDFIGLNYYHGGTVSAPQTQVSTSKKNFSKTDPYLMAGDSNKGIIPERVLFQSVDNPYLSKSDWGWEIDPVGFRVAMRQIYEKYQLPILVTENGLGAVDKLSSDYKIDDYYRIEYLSNHILSLKDALDDGVPVFGYCVWSFTDLLSWLNGYDKRYGLVYIDRNDNDVKQLKRYPKASYYWYQKIINSNGSKI